jgi:Ca-activated chloride channel family protein
MNYFAHPHFAEPRWLWLAVAGPLLLLALQRYAAGARRRQLEKIATPHFLTELTRSHSPARRTVKEVLLLLTVAAFGLALARPQWGEQKLAEQELTGEDIMFVLDCSRSMWSTDVAPNRIERARLGLLDFIHHRSGGRVGLVAFSGEAFLQCPLTFDYGAFEDALLAVDDKTIAVPGTDIGGALDTAVKTMEKDSRRKVVVLLTDGEDLEHGGVDQAVELGKQGVVIYTVGVGTPGGSQIKITNERGQPELLRDKDGAVVTSRLDEATLREIAQATHGAYFPLGPLGEGLARVQSSLTELAARADAARDNKSGVDRFQYPLAAALVWLVGESLLSTRRRKAAP